MNTRCFCVAVAAMACAVADAGAANPDPGLVSYSPSGANLAGLVGLVSTADPGLAMAGLAIAIPDRDSTVLLDDWAPPVDAGDFVTALGDDYGPYGPNRLVVRPAPQRPAFELGLPALLVLPVLLLLIAVIRRSS